MNTNIMTKKESIVLVNIMFYLLTITFVTGALLFFVMLDFGHSMLRSFILSVTIGISLPTALFVLFVSIYSLVASKISALFHKYYYTLPLIGLEKSSFAIINLQTKFSIFLRDASIVVVIFYLLSLLPFSNTIEFIYIILKITLPISILLVIGTTALDGIYIYFRCLFEIVFQLFKAKVLNPLQKSKFNNIFIFLKSICMELTYRPKHLKKWSLVSGFIETLTHPIARRGKEFAHKALNFMYPLF